MGVVVEIMSKRTDAPLLDYAFACLIDQKSKLPFSQYTQKSFQRIPKSTAQGLVITWVNQSTGKYYNRSSLTKEITMPGPELHQVVARSLSFSFQGSKKMEIFQMHCRIHVVQAFEDVVTSSTKFLDRQAFSVEYTDGQGKKMQRFFFPQELTENNITSMAELEDFCEQRDWTVHEVRSVQYYTEQGVAMDQRTIKKLYDANFKSKGGQENVEVISSPKKAVSAQVQQRAKSKREPVTPKKAPSTAAPKQVPRSPSQGKVKKAEKKGGSGCLFIGIFIAVCVVFMMAYFSATFDIKEEDFLANYDVLGLHPDTATLSEVKKQFHVLSRKYHPDKNPNCPECEAKYAAIAHAKSVITDRLKAQGAQEDAMNDIKSRPPGEAPRARSRY